MTHIKRINEMAVRNIGSIDTAVKRKKEKDAFDSNVNKRKIQYAKKEFFNILKTFPYKDAEDMIDTFNYICKQYKYELPKEILDWYEKYWNKYSLLKHLKWCNNSFRDCINNIKDMSAIGFTPEETFARYLGNKEMSFDPNGGCKVALRIIYNNNDKKLYCSLNFNEIKRCDEYVENECEVVDDVAVVDYGGHHYIRIEDLSDTLKNVINIFSKGCDEFFKIVDNL